MTQQHIRKQAGWGWPKRAWARLHEPRWISFIYGGAYSLMVILGGVSIFSPPRTIENAAGDVLMSLIALLVTTGGVLGVIMVSNGRYWVERYAVGLAAIGVFGYWLMVAYLAVATTGNRWLQLLCLTLALLFVLMRLHWILRRDYNPRLV